MINKNVCPNCGQLYDTTLAKCPLCGTAPQVVEAETGVQRRRITEAERRQRRAERKEAEQEARRRQKDEQLLRDAEEERLFEEAEAARKQEKLRKKMEKKAQKDLKAGRTPVAAPAAPEPAPQPDETPLVPRRAATPAPAKVTRPPQPEPRPAKDRGRVPRGLLVFSTLLLLLTLAIGGSYLAWKTKLLDIPIYDKLLEYRDQAQQIPETTAAPTETTQATVACKAVVLSEQSLTFTEAGQTTQLVATLEPADCTDPVTFASSDETVAKVGSTGVVTAVGSGSAVITVTCGEITAQCAVTCTLPETTEAPADTQAAGFRMRQDDITFFEAGESTVLLLDNLPEGAQVEWASQDESIATVDSDGHVTAVGKGTTNVTATVDGVSATCIVRCNFRE